MNKAFEISLSLYGTKEIAGIRHNPLILKMFKESGFENIQNDETAWCSAFMNYCQIKAGNIGTGSLMARSWLNWGIKVLAPVEKPQIGDVVVFYRQEINCIFGHVGFYVNETENFINVLGGNQNNQVKISAYSKNELLGIRRY